MTTVYPTIKVITSDEKEVTIDSKIIKFFVTLKNMIDDIKGTEYVNIPLPNVSYDVLNIIIEYCEHHVDDTFDEEPEPAVGKIRPCTIKDSWDVELMAKISHIKLAQILNASNYLDIKQMYSLGCKIFAKRLKAIADKCTSIEDSRRRFKEEFEIECDFTEEEKAKIESENKWVYDSQ